MSAAADAGQLLPGHGRGAGLPVDSEALTEALNAFAGTVTGDFSVSDIMRQLALAVTRVLDIDGAGVMSPSPDGDLLRLAFATRGPVRELEMLQEVLQDGPCADSHASGRVVNLADIVQEGSWPQYQQRADELDLHAVCTIPLRARGRGWGVLDTYRTAALPLSDHELAAALTLANLATSYLVVTHDRDVARGAQDQLADRAMHDLLTGLPVRWVFLEQLAHALAQLRRNPAHIAVLFLDLDGLKYVNDTFGHLTGDQLLSTCAARMRGALRPSDVLARIGGDEFVVLLEHLAEPADAAVVAQRVLDALAVPIEPDGQVITPSASIGIAVTSDPGTGSESLIAHADAAMYRAKHAGRGRYELFDPRAYATDRAEAAAREQLVGELRTALVTGQLEVHYQPIIDLTDARPMSARMAGGSLYAVEALLRWRHPERGLLAAGEFIETAERAGLLPELGSWALRQACQQVADWDRALGGRAPQRLFVNLSVSELVDPPLLGHVRAVLDDTGVLAGRITIEITETGVVQQPLVAAHALDALRSLGCELAIDDFGTGYSSLSRLIDIPASTLKIDQAFSRDIDTSPGAAAVIAVVLTLGVSLQRVVIVEGVETSHALEQLRQLGVTHVQGFHLARPMHPAGLLAQLS